MKAGAVCLLSCVTVLAIQCGELACQGACCFCVASCSARSLAVRWLQIAPATGLPIKRWPLACIYPSACAVRQIAPGHLVPSAGCLVAEQCITCSPITDTATHRHPSSTAGSSLGQAVCLLISAEALCARGFGLRSAASGTWRGSPIPLVADEHQVARVQPAGLHHALVLAPCYLRHLPQAVSQLSGCRALAHRESGYMLSEIAQNADCGRNTRWPTTG